MIVLLEKQEEELSISKISKYSNIDYENTYNIIKDMEKKNLIVNDEREQRSLCFK